MRCNRSGPISFRRVFGGSASASKQTDCLAADESAGELPIAKLPSSGDARDCRTRRNKKETSSGSGSAASFLSDGDFAPAPKPF
jgi:hypothetical protein